jgi:hypothetical protein
MRHVEEATPAEIGAAQEVTVATVRKRIERVQPLLDAGDATAAELQRRLDCERLEFAYREAMRAWRRSRESARTTKVSNTDGKQKAEKIEQSQVGDVRFLQQAQRIMADLTAVRAGLAGAAAEPGHSLDPTPVQDADVTALSLEQRAAELDRLLQSAVDGGGETSGD